MDIMNPKPLVIDVGLVSGLGVVLGSCFYFYQQSPRNVLHEYIYDEASTEIVLKIGPPLI